MTSIRNLLMVVLFAHLLSGCGGSSSTLTTWRNPGHTGGGYGGLVILMQHRSLAVQQAVEDEVVRLLTDRGIVAVAAHSFIAPDRKYSPEELKTQFSLKAFDGIMMIEQLGSSDIKEFIPGETFYDSYVYTYDRSRRPMSEVVVQPGYYEQAGRVYQTESNLYDTQSGTLVWRGQSETPLYEGQSVDVAARSYASAVVDDLVKEGLVKQRIPPR